MKWDFKFVSSIAGTARALIEQAEALSNQDPQLQEVAGQVYVGDIYSLREDVCPAHDDGWGQRCYTCAPGVPCL